ncbi:hypothetical protein RB595_009669 [Gaeumannomyces hyphopodioides]
MPRATHPLTPASSTDLKSQDGSKQLASLQMSFELPPPALSARAKASPADSESSPQQSQAKTPYPLQASETVKSRRRPSTLQSSVAPVTAAKDSFALPPPPTRSRKIIQMKPRTQDETEAQTSGGGSKSGGGAKSTAAATAAAAGSGAAPSGSSTGAGASAGKKRQPSATSAAGRKMARKTAHSLIERRRRSKMNEEFATLKNMIPACTGEMHKLAILQASIEYVRYLEDCVSKLKAQREDASAPMEFAPPPMTTYDGDEDQHNRLGPGSGYDAYMANSADDDDDDDVDMHGGAELPSPTFTANPAQASSTHSTSVSPALLGADSRRRNDSYSSTSTPVLGPDGRRYSLASATTPSPAFGPQTYPAGLPYSSRPGSALTSPALQPLRDVDHEATAALLMLNSDRRGAANGSVGASGAGTGRGMSVRDLLST